MPCWSAGARATVVGPGLGTPGLGRATAMRGDAGAGVGTGCGTLAAYAGAIVAGAALGVGVRESGRDVGTLVGAAEGATVGRAFTVTAIAVTLGKLRGKAAMSGSGELLTACSAADGLGAPDATGTGVGFGGAVGAILESSCNMRGCRSAEGCGRLCALPMCGACGKSTAAGFVRDAGAMARVLICTISLPCTKSGATCSDDEVATANSNTTSTT